MGIGHVGAPIKTQKLQRITFQKTFVLLKLSSTENTRNPQMSVLGLLHNDLKPLTKLNEVNQKLAGLGPASFLARSPPDKWERFFRTSASPE